LKIEHAEYFEFQMLKRLYDEDNSFFLIECFPKKDTQLFISARHQYPNEKEYKWAFGDLPAEIIESSKVNPSMRDILTEATPFEFNKDA
jgi:hypothetical protein